ncbi:hypothetical protein LCGC14_1511200 [marine sediment metagenome]|uniref:HMA domain-containing protein n=1 Tax=marine sediment metagenome TaxID=412755 RepID=A0A0F9J1E4_9ZZZZ
MKIQDRIKRLTGVVNAHWDSEHSRLVVFYHAIPLDTIKIRVVGEIASIQLQRSVEEFTFWEV